jgi:hypothetical protein
MARPLATRAHILGARCFLSTLGAHRPSFWFVLGCPGAPRPREGAHSNSSPTPARPRAGPRVCGWQHRRAPSPPPPQPGVGAARVRRMRAPRAGDHRPVSCALARALQARTAFYSCGAARGHLAQSRRSTTRRAPRDPGYGCGRLYWYAPRASGACGSVGLAGSFVPAAGRGAPIPSPFPEWRGRVGAGGPRPSRSALW